MNARERSAARNAAFVPQQTVDAVRGDLAREGGLYRVRFERTSGKESATYFFDFGGHPLRDLIPTYLFEGAEEQAGSTIYMKCFSLRVLWEFLIGAGEGSLTPRVYKAYLGWLVGVKNQGGGTRFAPSVINTHAHKAKEVYAWGLEHGFTGFDRRGYESIEEIARSKLRGNGRRAMQKSVDEAVSAETYYYLLKAVSLEFEQCKVVRAARDAGERPTLHDQSARGLKRLDPNPYVVLSLMAALRHGVRSSEVNTFNRDDLRVDGVRGEHDLYVHAPNKPDDYLPVDDAFVTAWQLCDEWGKEARSIGGGPEPEVGDPLLVYLSTFSSPLRPLIQLTTDHLNEILLPYFYRKWFAYRITDANGCERPLLHAEGDASSPFRIAYSKLRNSFAVRFADRERSRVMMRRVMRHADIGTTERHYLQQTRLDYAKKVQAALKPEAQCLVMQMKNAALAGLGEETLQEAHDRGALLPHGICGSAMEGVTCARASDCLECPHLVVIASRKPRFEADRDDYLGRAERLHQEGDLRGAENALSRAKICQAHIIRIEDTFERGVR